MRNDKNAPEAVAKTNNNAEPGSLPTDSIDFTDTIERLKTRATQARNTGRKNKIQSTFVAVFAATALLTIVVGGEDVVRRWLVPDLSDIAAAKLESANKSVKAAAAESIAQNVKVIAAKAKVETIHEQKAAAESSVLDYEIVDKKRAIAFIGNQKALAVKSATDAKYVKIKKTLVAAQQREKDELK